MGKHKRSYSRSRSKTR